MYIINTFGCGRWFTPNVLTNLTQTKTLVNSDLKKASQMLTDVN